MLVVFVVDTSASMNQSTSSGMTLLDYAKSAVERFVKRVRDPSRRYQHHFMLVSCGGQDPNASKSTSSRSTSTYSTAEASRVRVGWDQSTNKETFLSTLKTLQATHVSDLGAALRQGWDLMNQVRLQFYWDSYGLGRLPWNTNLAVCVLLTDATTLSNADGMIQESLNIPPSRAIGSDLTTEPYRWDQRLFTVALKLPATNNNKPQASVPSDLMALSEATGGMLYMPTSKSAVELSIDQIILKLKVGAAVKFKCEASVDGNSDSPVSRNIMSPVMNGREFCWPIPEAFWLDRNSASLPPRDAHPTLSYRCTEESAIEVATNHMLLDQLKFPADTYTLDFPLSPSPPKGDPIGFIRAGQPSGSNAQHHSGNPVCVLLPYNYPVLFSLLVDAARVYQASGQNLNSTNGTWQFQAKAMPSAWRESFATYLNGCPLYYYFPLKKILRKYNLHEMVPEVQDSGRSYQISAYLSRLREQSINENETNNKLVMRAHRNEAASRQSSRMLWGPLATMESSPSASPVQNARESISQDTFMETVGNMSMQELMEAHKRGKRELLEESSSRNRTKLSLGSSRPANDAMELRLMPSPRAVEEDEKHSQPIETMSDYESRLVHKEALRNPLGEPDPDEDTPNGLRRRQLSFNLGNPYKKNAHKQQMNVYQGEAADEAATLGGQSPKRKRTRKRSSQLKRERRLSKRSRRAPSSPSYSSSPGSPSHSPNSSPSSVTSSSPGSMDMASSAMSEEAAIDTSLSLKADAAQMLGVPLMDGEFVQQSKGKGFSRLIYSVLVENWEAWSTVLALLKARKTSKQEEEFIVNALKSMKGGDTVIKTYVRQAIRHANKFKKQDLSARLQGVLTSLVTE